MFSVRCSAKKGFHDCQVSLGDVTYAPHLSEAVRKHSTSPEKFCREETAQSCLTCSFPNIRRMVTSLRTDCSFPKTATTLFPLQPR